MTPSPAPIQNVPNDLLQEIFLRCLPQHTWRTSLAPSECPVLLTHVCQRWRKVSFLFPVLWKSLKWDVLRIKFDETRMQLLAAAAGRAGLYPHTLQIILRTRSRAEDTRGNDPFHPIPNVVDAIAAPCTEALTRLVLKGVPVRDLHRVPSGTFPLLADLVLELFGADIQRFPWATQGPIQAFSGAPALRRVCLSNFPSLESFGHRHLTVSNLITLPWKRLTSLLEFEYPSGPSSLFPHLIGCLSLRYLFATIGDSDVGQAGYSNWVNTPSTCLDRLRCLTLFFWGRSAGHVGYPAFIDIFKFPNLQALRFSGAGFSFDDHLLNWDSPVLVDRFLSNISDLKHLTYLSLCVNNIAPNTLRRVLYATPHITTLDAAVYDNYKFFFEGLTWGVDKLLPKLGVLILELDNSLAIDDGEGYTIDPESFRAFLDSRVESQEHDTLHRVVVYSKFQEYLGDEVPFIEVALQYTPRGLVLDRRLVTEERKRRISEHWMDRDPELRDWPELVETE